MENLSTEDLQAFISLADAANQRHFEAVLGDDQGWLDNEFGRFYFACLPAMFAQAAALAQVNYINTANPHTVKRMAQELLALRATTQAAPATGEAWVSVQDRLPAHKTDAIFGRVEGGVVQQGYFLAFDQWNRPNQVVVGGGFNPVSRYTHWMPLPTPPTANPSQPC